MSPLSGFPPWLRRVVLAALVAELAIIAVNVAGLIDERLASGMLDLDAETNLPVWFSSVLLIAAAGCAAAIWLARPDQVRDWHWLVIALGMLLLSMEEVVSIHERTYEYLRDAGWSGAHPSIWPLAYSPVLVVGVIALVRAARDLPPRLRGLTLGAVASFLVVIAAELAIIWDDLPAAEAVVIIEEAAEFSGTMLILMAAAAFLMERVVVTRRDPGPATQEARRG